MIYVRDPAPGQFDHRSGDCEKHGANIAFARPYKSSLEPYECCECNMEKQIELVSHELHCALYSNNSSGDQVDAILECLELIAKLLGVEPKP